MENITKIIVHNKENFISAAVILGLTYVVGFSTSRLLKSSFVRITGKIRGKKSKQLEAAQLTRLKMLKRLLILIIYFIGIAVALSVFDTFQKLGTALLASAGLFGVIGGLAARASLANVLAGLIISFAQPFMIGDKIVIDENKGVVKEITLMYTKLESKDGEIVIPNSVLNESIVNKSISP